MIDRFNSTHRTALFSVALFAAAALSGVSRAVAQEPNLVFDEGFESGLASWEQKRLSRDRTQYTVLEEAGNPVLRANAERSATALLRPIEADLSLLSSAMLSWSWRVDRVLSENEDERTKDGDDYAGRIFVIFGSGELGPDTRALCYVWAAHEPEGSVYRNPFAEGVATIVVRSGDMKVDEWVHERRDVLADYRRAFGMEPEPIAAIALLVDTDNTKSRAITWFDSIALTVEEADTAPS